MDDVGSKIKTYAIKGGRHGQKICFSRDELMDEVEDFPDAVHAAFDTELDALRWLYSNALETDSHATAASSRPNQALSRAARPGFRYAPYPSPRRSESSVDNTNRADLIGSSIRFSEATLSQARTTRETPIVIHSDSYEDSKPDKAILAAIMGQKTEVSTTSVEPAAAATQSKPEDGPPIATQNDVVVADEEDLQLGDEQKHVLERALAGESIFFTGPAGVGKSELLKAIIRAMRTKHTHPNHCAVTASVGIAAANIGGTTLHSWAGLGLAKKPVDALYKQLIFSYRRQDTIARWRNCRVLIIDEVSMLNATFFEKLEELARRIRENDAPFGGIQLVITGDFFQLPPIPDGSSQPGQPRDEARFVFESPAWKLCVPNMVVLSQVYRQRDSTFVKLLNELRVGNASREAICIFKALERKVHYDDDVEPTSLFAKRTQVLAENARRLKQLSGENIAYRAHDVAGFRKAMDEETLRATLDKIGAQVMLVKNLKTRKLVNRSVGRVIGFANAGQVIHADVSRSSLFEPFGHTGDVDVKPVKQEPGNPARTSREDNDSKASTFSNLLDGVEVGREELTERERARRGFAPLAQTRNDDVPLKRTWPVVLFPNNAKILLPPMDFVVEDSNGEVEATRSQIPLILAWALSIHKSQGQTIERVRVDMGEIFEAGQAYVALSRATRMVLRFSPSKITAHPKVVAWYKAIADEKKTEDRPPKTEK